jgi:hypothetical protein
MHKTPHKCAALNSFVLLISLATNLLFIPGCCVSKDNEAKPVAGELDRVGAIIGIDATNRTYTIIVKNNSSVPIGVWNNVTDSEYTHRDFGPAQIRVRNAAGSQLPALSSSAAEWWTFGALSSQAWLLPIHLTPLAPGQTLTGTFSLDTLMLGNDAWNAMGKNDEMFREHREFQLQFQMFYGSPMLDKKKVVFSQWFSIGGAANPVAAEAAHPGQSVAEVAKP